MKTITIHNRKGGTGKSVITFMVAGFLSSGGRRVLVVDMDGQKSITGYYSRILDREFRGPTTLDVMEGLVLDDSAIQQLQENLWLIPSSPKLTSIETSAMTPALAKYLEPLKNRFDYILIDTAGYWSPLTQAAFQAADEVVIPVFSRVDDMEQALDTIKRAEMYKLKCRIVLNQFRGSKNDHAVVESFATDLNGSLMRATIPLSPAFQRYVDTGEKMSNAKSKLPALESIRDFVREALGEELSVEAF